MVSQAILDRPILVLNKGWMPIQTMTARKAIGLVAGGAARIIDPVTLEVHDLDSWNAVSRERERLRETRIRSMRLSLEPPQVIVLTAYEGLARRGIVFSRANLYRRDRYTCQYCGLRPSVRELSIDHVVPRSRGGPSSWENCVVACFACNTRKGNRLPREAGMSLERKPVKPRWSPLFSRTAESQCESWGKFLSRAYWEVELRD
jgi:5-methylcytosine-specific restriction endonuclease McrA